ncbi:hypothetical protein O6H91_08G079700 [Diphasiastrum complanatum]|uniref:Uncharacterized protein n=1 Tax=Diphasiastrum complanatum TaxID=34168 RepID=A0ACC2CZA5_DIPCM|nr:hypothetical protein O6H91_08G079700 [Diphasiastrum complanatum]
MKCKQKAGQVLGNQTEPMCKDCLRLSLLSKFKTGLNHQGAVGGSDKVLVAFSGGPGSRLALQFLCELQSKLQDEAESCKDRNSAVFDVGVAFVDESGAQGIPLTDAQKTLDEIASVVAEVRPTPLPLHLTSLESLFENEVLELQASSKLHEDDNSGKDNKDKSRQRLIELLSRVEDQTGKEDLVEHMRMDALQRVAKHYGYTRVVLGLCTTRVAARVLAATAKGEGFALPAGIQYVDARWPVPVLLPLRDCVSKELSVLCHLTNLKTVFLKKMTAMGNSRASINSLTHSFISLINEENPSREYTIMRTAAKLIPFGFNKLAQDDSMLHFNGRPRNPHARRNLGRIEPCEIEVLCPICSAPLAKSDFSSLQPKVSVSDSFTRMSLEEAFEPSTSGIDSELLPSKIFRDVCCPSCQYQIIPDQSKDSVLELLPLMVQQRAAASLLRKEGWMREYIGDCLLESDE